MRGFLLIFVVAVVALAKIDHKQLNGLKRLLKKLDAGVLPTCKIIFFSEQVDFDTADNNCKNFRMGTGKAENGNLATVNDEEKNADLKMLLEMGYPIAESPDPKDKWSADKWVWAGLRKTHNNGYDGEFSKKYNPFDWEWADKSNPKEYKRWFNKKQPDQAMLKKGKKKGAYKCEESPACYQNQMRINHDGKWDDTYKFMKHPYACDYQGKYILSATPRFWDAAKKACEDAGLHMAMVRNEEELSEILDAAKFFLGERNETLREFSNHNWFWIGGNDIADEGKWRWEANNEEIDAAWLKKMPWRRPNPDNAERVGETGQDVMAISILGAFVDKKGKRVDRGGMFDDSYTSKRKRPFACQCPGS